jgi:hypothetical protein
MLKKIIFAMVVMLSITLATAQEKQKTKWSFHGECVLEGALQYSLDQIALKNIPLDIRNVPMHPDDGGTPGAIADSSLQDRRCWIILPLRINIGMQNAKWQCKVGAYGEFGVTYPQLAERNYTNAPGTATRGMGAALTYMKIDQLRPKFGFTVEAEYHATHIQKMELFCFVQYMKSWYNLNLVTGWDRNDEQKRYETYPIGRISGHQVLLGPECRWQKIYFLRIALGYQWNNIKTFAWGQKMNVSVPNTMFFQVSGGMNFTMKKKKKE